jgi:hypothetical protein
MSNTITFNDFNELLDYCKKNNLESFEIEVESNPGGEGGPQKLNAHRRDDVISTFAKNQNYINDIDYVWDFSWHTKYKGKVKLFLPENDSQFKKPEVYKKGDIVVILESARECADFNKWGHKEKEMIGKKSIIDFAMDNNYGVYYKINDCFFPHYCVKKVNTLEITFDEVAKLAGVDPSKLKIIT